jgi:hypothetical protein
VLKGPEPALLLGRELARASASPRVTT